MSLITSSTSLSTTLITMSTAAWTVIQTRSMINPPRQESTTFVQFLPLFTSETPHWVADIHTI
jgi:hypothetical protein